MRKRVKGREKRGEGKEKRRVYVLWTLVGVLSVMVVMCCWREYQRSVVVHVVDGDTVDLSDGRRVRLLGIDAPEMGRCMSGEAKDRLASIVDGKRVTLHDTFRDEYGRTLANVSVGKSYVNEILVAEGLAKFRHAGTQMDEKLEKRYIAAEENHLGIFSPQCRSIVPPESKPIKGNIRSGKRQYYLPACAYYDQVIVDTSYGDEWFGSEDEARGEGFVLAPSCV